MLLGGVLYGVWVGDCVWFKCFGDCSGLVLVWVFVGRLCCGFPLVLLLLLIWVASCLRCECVCFGFECCLWV